MAHIEKYKAPAVGHMLAHYRRDKSAMGRENIDPERTHGNVALSATWANDALAVESHPALEVGGPGWADVKARIDAVNASAELEGLRRVRKDAVVLADVVVTLPENVRPEDTERFFTLTYEWLARQFGADNLLGGFVHKDEVRKDGSPVREHMHVPFTPILAGRFNYKKMVPRAFYQGFHRELGDWLEERMGYRPEVELAEETRAQRVYADKSTDIERVRAAVESNTKAEREELARVGAELEDTRGELEGVYAEVRGAEDRLEGLRRTEDALAREVEALEPAAEGITESLRTLSEGRGDGSREKALGREIGELGARIGELEQRIGEQRERLSELDAGIGAAKRDASAIDGECAEMGERERQAVGRYRLLQPTYDRLGERVNGILYAVADALDHIRRFLRAFGNRYPKGLPLTDFMREFLENEGAREYEGDFSKLQRPSWVRPKPTRLEEPSHSRDYGRRGGLDLGGKSRGRSR